MTASDPGDDRVVRLLLLIYELEIRFAPQRITSGLGGLAKHRRPQLFRIALAVIGQVEQPLDDFFDIRAIRGRLSLSNDLLEDALNLGEFIGTVRAKCHNAKRAARAAS
ncbi:protein of unknown function [Hyphomicrobium sp. MC1]|nr:protein of unknown function [Hyphomicrobium sp. MC1]